MSIILSIRHSDCHYAEYHLSGCHNVELSLLSVVIVGVILSVVPLRVIILIDFMIDVVMLSVCISVVVILSIVKIRPPEDFQLLFY